MGVEPSLLLAYCVLNCNVESIGLTKFRSWQSMFSFINAKLANTIRKRSMRENSVRYVKLVMFLVENCTFL